MMWCIAAVPAVAQSAAADAPQKVQAAYELALKCFVAAGHGYINRRDANDQARATYYDDRAKHSWYTALRLSTQLGYSTNHFQADAKAVSDRELPPIINDPIYFKQVADECKAYGLM